MPSYMTPGASIWVKAMRLSPLDAVGNLIAGVGTLVTDALIKLTITPQVETGDTVNIKGASGDLAVFGKHGDIPKWYTVSIEIAVPDSQLEAALAGGVVYSDSSTALGAPTGLTATAKATVGTLPAGTYAYQVAQFNTNGATTPGTEVIITTVGAGSVLLRAMTAAVGADGWVFFGRVAGGIGQIGTLRNIGAQTTSAASGVGSPTTLAVTALTKPIPEGFTFTIAGDTNASPIVFTTTAAATTGATAIAVTTSEAITVTIAAGALVPTFVDTGAVTPGAQPNASDLSGGAGVGVGYQVPVLGSVANPNGVAIECWGERYIDGEQASDLPYWWHLLPRVKNLHRMPADLTNANFASTFDGDAFGNPNFGSGPDGTWDFDSSAVYQRRACSALIVPTPSVTPQTSLY